MTGVTVSLTHLPFTTDAGIAARARIGLVVLASDLTIEHEWRKVLAGLDGVALHHARIYNDPRITPETLRGQQGIEFVGRSPQYRATGPTEQVASAPDGW